MEAIAVDNTALVQRIGLPIHQSKGWLKLLGVLSIVYGGILAITIVGIVIAWLPIWTGVLLYQAATLVDRAYTSGDEHVLTESLGKLKLYFTIAGVLALLGLICVALMMAFGVFGAMVSLLNHR